MKIIILRNGLLMILNNEINLYLYPTSRRTAGTGPRCWAWAASARPVPRRPLPDRPGTARTSCSCRSTGRSGTWSPSRSDCGCTCPSSPWSPAPRRGRARTPPPALCQPPGWGQWLNTGRSLYVVEIHVINHRHPMCCEHILSNFHIVNY